MTRPPIKRTLLGATLLTLAALYPSGSSGGDVLRWVRPGAAETERVETALKADRIDVDAAAVANEPPQPMRFGITGRGETSGPVRLLASADPAAAAPVAATLDAPVVSTSYVPVENIAAPTPEDSGVEFETVPVSTYTPPDRHPWKDEDAVFVLDAYEFNELDWKEMATDERIYGFISKSSDGMPEVYDCRNGGLGNSSPRHCKTRWRKYSVTKELYNTRRDMAKMLGWKWGAYHLGRPGNPEAQADHFLEFADPQPDEFIAIDIEDNDPEKWMSLEEAERFARRIHQRIGRWPALYTNHSTAKYIAQKRESYPILSRLPLWYARFRPEIEGVFPMGNWENYHTWQFLAQINCKRNCAMRPKGTNKDIDVNVVNATDDTLDAMWATSELLPWRGERDVPTLMVDAKPTPTKRSRTPETLTAFAATDAGTERARAVFDSVLQVEDSVKAQLAPGTPVPTMRPNG